MVYRLFCTVACASGARFHVVIGQGCDRAGMRVRACRLVYIYVCARCVTDAERVPNPPHPHSQPHSHFSPNILPIAHAMPRRKHVLISTNTAGRVFGFRELVGGEA